MRKWLLWTFVVALLFSLYRYYNHRQEMEQQFSGLSDSFAGKYLAARFAEHRSDPIQAAKSLTAAFKKEPNSILLLERAFALNVMAGRMDEAVTLARRYRELQPRAFAANNMLAIAEMRKGNFVGADQFLQSVTAGANEDEMKMHSLLLPIIRGWVLVGQGRYPDARQLLDTIDARADLLPFILYQRALMADVAGNAKDAARLYDTLLKSTVRPSYRLTQAASSFFNRIGRKDRAQEVLQTFNELHPALAMTAVPKVPPIASATEGLAEFFMETGSLLFGRRMEETSLVYLHLALYLRPDLSYAQFLLASVQESREIYKEAIRYYDMLAPGDPFYKEAQFAIVRNYYRLGKKKKAKSLLETRLRIKRDDPEVLGMLADFALQEKRFEDAENYYTSLLEISEEENQNRWSWHFARGIALEQLGKWKKAEPDFEKALELQPSHPEVLNYLGYTWVTQGVNLEKALDMLQRAMEARPNDPHIIDSYAWALYALGQYEDALPYMERANELIPADPTVNDHLGDIYWMLGRQREARFQWERALSFNPEPKDAQKIRQKLEHGLSSGKN